MRTGSHLNVEWCLSHRKTWMLRPHRWTKRSPLFGLGFSFSCARVSSSKSVLPLDGYQVVLCPWDRIALSFWVPTFGHTGCVRSSELEKSSAFQSWDEVVAATYLGWKWTARIGGLRILGSLKSLKWEALPEEVSRALLSSQGVMLRDLVWFLWRPEEPPILSTLPSVSVRAGVQLRWKDGKGIMSNWPLRCKS